MERSGVEFGVDEKQEIELAMGTYIFPLMKEARKYHFEETSFDQHCKSGRSLP